MQDTFLREVSGFLKVNSGLHHGPPKRCKGPVAVRFYMSHLLLSTSLGCTFPVSGPGMC